MTKAEKKERNESKKETCFHKKFYRSTVMDFSFYICKDCGFQWETNGGKIESTSLW